MSTDNKPTTEQILEALRVLDEADAQRLTTEELQEAVRVLDREGKPKDVVLPMQCPNCYSPNIAKIKGCIRCLKCGFKEDCYGW